MLRRLLRWGFHLAAALSLGLFLLSAAAGVRAQFVGDVWGVFSRHTDLPHPPGKGGEYVWVTGYWQGVVLPYRDGVSVTVGWVVMWSPSELERQADSRHWARTSHLTLAPEWRGDPRGSGPWYTSWWRPLSPGVRYFDNTAEVMQAPPRRRVSFKGEAVYIPYWCLLAGTALVPVLWLRRWHRRRQLRLRGCCAKCGYDLRASKDSCPECGAPIPETPARTRI